MDDQVRDDADDQRDRERRDVEQRAARDRVAAEAEIQAADAADQNGADDEQVAAVAEVDLMQHLQAGDRDEAVQRDARAAHDALRNRVDQHDERREERKHHAAERRREDRNDRGVARDRDAGDRLAVRRVRAATEESADDRADAVAEQRTRKPGVAQEVGADDGRGPGR